MEIIKYIKQEIQYFTNFTMIFKNVNHVTNINDFILQPIFVIIPNKMQFFLLSEQKYNKKTCERYLL